MLRVFLVLVVLLSSAFSLSGQGWLQMYGNSEEDFGRVIHQLANGDFVIGGFSEADGVSQQAAIWRVDQDGFVIWEALYGLDQWEEFLFNCRETPEGDLVFVGKVEFSTGDVDPYLLKINPRGEVVWEQKYNLTGVENSWYDLEILADGSIYAVGRGNDQLNYAKLSPNGVLLWQQSVVAVEANAVQQLNFNQLLIGGFREHLEGPDLVMDPFVFLVDSTGAIIWEFTHIDTTSTDLVDLLLLSDGGIVFAGQSCYDISPEGSGAAINTCMPYVAKLAADGSDLEWLTTINPEIGIGGTTVAVVENSQNQLIATGRRDQLATIQRLSPQGELLDEQFYSLFGETGVGCSILNTSRGYAVTGHADIGENGPGAPDVFFLSVNEELEFISSRLTILLNETTSADCSSLDRQVSNVQIELKNKDTGHSYFGYTQAGVCSIALPGGEYDFFIHNISDAWKVADCHLDGVSVDTDDWDGINLFIQKDYDCEEVRVTTSAPTLTPCELADYKIAVCNEGTISPENSAVAFWVDSDLTVISSSHFYEEDFDNDRIIFQLQDLGLGICEQITVSCQLSCDYELGRTTKVKAELLEAPNCSEIDSNYDGSAIELSAICEGDSVRFSFLNKGEETEEDLQYRIIEDNVIVISFPKDFAAGELMEVVRPSNGTTMRAEINQVSTYPLLSEPSQVIESCGADLTSLGFVADLPENDVDGFIDIDLFETAAWNTDLILESFPSGIGEEHLIDQSVPIEYKIRIKQDANSIRTVARVQLSEFLDVASLSIGVSSGDPLFRIIEDNVIVIAFDGDDFIDGVAFIKFEINQLPFLANGTIIETAVTRIDEEYRSGPAVHQLKVQSPLLSEELLQKSILWSSFTGKIKNDFNQLDWTTSAEYLSQRFEVMHSTDGIYFNPLWETESHESNSSLGSAYTFNHYGLDCGMHLYRVDHYNDFGLKESTNTIMLERLNCGNEGLQGIYPLPSSDILTVDYLLLEEGELEVGLSSITGIQVLDQSVQLKEGLNSFTLAISDLPVGIYVMSLKELGGEAKHYRVVKD